MAKGNQQFDFQAKIIQTVHTGCSNSQSILRMGSIVAMLFTLRESRRAPDPALPRARSSRLRLRPWMPCLWNPPTFATI